MFHILYNIVFIVFSPYVTCIMYLLLSFLRELFWIKYAYFTILKIKLSDFKGELVPGWFYFFKTIFEMVNKGVLFKLFATHIIMVARFYKIRQNLTVVIHDYFFCWKCFLPYFNHKLTKVKDLWKSFYCLLYTHKIMYTYKL